MTLTDEEKKKCRAYLKLYGTFVLDLVNDCDDEFLALMYGKNQDFVQFLSLLKQVMEERGEQ